jgi:hypothetical protein
MIKWKSLFCLMFAAFAAISVSQAQNLPVPKGGPQDSARVADFPVYPESTPNVVIDGRQIFPIRTSVAGYSPEERAERISNLIVRLAKNPSFSVESVRVEPRESWSEIVAGDTRLVVITEAEAKAAGVDRSSLAAENAEIIRFTIRQYREDHTWKNVSNHCLRSGDLGYLASASVAVQQV